MSLLTGVEIRAKLESLYLKHLAELCQPEPDGDSVGRMTGRELIEGLMAGVNNQGELGHPFLPRSQPWPDLAVPIMATELGIDLFTEQITASGVISSLRRVVDTRRSDLIPA